MKAGALTEAASAQRVARSMAALVSHSGRQLASTANETPSVTETMLTGSLAKTAHQGVCATGIAAPPRANPAWATSPAPASSTRAITRATNPAETSIDGAAASARNAAAMARSAWSARAHRAQPPA
jgi:hypothetical protein